MVLYDKILSFLEINPEISVRQVEGLSLATRQGLTREM
jgi:hypothetical protein